MNIEEYAQLLKNKEWEKKRESILKRDDYTCQKCGCRGFSFRSFKISNYSELEELMYGWTIEDKPVIDFLKDIKWSSDEYISMSIFERKHIRLNRWLINFSDNENNTFSYVSDNSLLHSYLKEEFLNIKICNNDRESSTSIDLYAFKLRSCNLNNYIKIFDKVGDVSILIDNKLYIFRTQNPYHIFRFKFLNFVTLHVHHKYYIENKNPWEYDNDALITLCSECHSETHNQEATPLFSKDGQLLILNLPICNRCNGRGVLPQYKYYMNGVCFKCLGTGVYMFDGIK